MVTIYTNLQLCHKSELMTHWNPKPTLYELGYKMSHYLVCSPFVHGTIYTYATCMRSAHKTGLQKMLKKGKADTVYNIIAELLFTQFLLSASTVFSLGTEEMNKQMPKLHTKQSTAWYFFPKLPHWPAALSAFRPSLSFHRFGFHQW